MIPTTAPRTITIISQVWRPPSVEERASSFEEGLPVSGGRGLPEAWDEVRESISRAGRIRRNIFEDIMKA
jgi:hypothetical protein